MKYIVYTLRNMKTPIYDTFRRMETQNTYDISSCLMPANGRSYAPVRDCEARLYPTSRNYDTGTAARNPLKPAWRMSCCWQLAFLP